MVASLLKVISKGMQNERLQPPDDQPDLGAFQTVFLKTGRYATQWARLEFDTMPDFNKSGIVRLVTQGELIGRILLVTQMPDILTQQRKAYYTRKPISLFSGNYTSVNLYEGTDYLTTVNFVYRGGPFTGVQFDDLIPGGTYSLRISKSVSTPSVSFLAVLTERPLSTAGFSLLTNTTLLVTGLTITTGRQLYAYSLNGTTWTPVNAPEGVNQGTINGIAFNGSYYISAGSCSGGPGLIAEDSTSIIAQPGNINPTLPGAISAFATNGRVIVAGGYLAPSTAGLNTFISLSSDGGLTWSPGYFSAGVNTDNFVASLAWSAGLNRFLAGGTFYNESSDVSLGLFSLSAPNDPTTWSSPSFPLAYGSTNVYTKSQVAIASLATLFTIGRPIFTWNSAFYSSLTNYSSIGTLAYGSTLYANPIFSLYADDTLVTAGVYDLFNSILTALTVGKATVVTGSITGTTLTLTAGTLTPPCYITGANIVRGTFVLSSISATQFTVNISQTAALNSINRFGALSNASLLGDYASYITSLSANFLGQLANITTALTTIATASSEVTTGVLTPVVGPVNDYYTAIQAIVGISQASITINTLNTILSNLITPSNYSSLTVANILAAKSMQSSYSSVLNYSPSNPISFQGSITGTTLTVSSITPAYALLAMQSPVTGTGVTPGTIITGMTTTYTTVTTSDTVSPEVFTATNTSPIGTILCSVSGTKLVVLSNSNNIDFFAYQFPLPISGEGIISGTTLLSGSGTQFILDRPYFVSTPPVQYYITINPAGSVTFLGSITNNVLTVFNACLASMIIPFSIFSLSLGQNLPVLSANPVTYTVNTSQTVSGTLTANVTGGIKPSLQTLSTVLTTNIIPNQGSIINTLTYLPQLMQACDNVNSACSQACIYYYSTMVPSDNRNFGLLSFLINQYLTTTQYTQSTTVPTLFWIGTPFGTDFPVFNTYSTSYTVVQSGQVNGIAVNGSTIVMVGEFYRGKDGITGYLGSIMNSTDSGATWSLPFDPGYVSGYQPDTYIGKAVVYTGFVWVAAGSWSSGSVTFSVDGVNWSSPVRPPNETGTGNALAVSPTGLLLGGSFTTAKGSTGSLSVASGNSIKFIWGTLVRPTPLLLNTVNVTRIQQNFDTYVAVGQWLSIAGSYLASIYTSSDYINWSPATLYNGITRAICYSVCSDDFSWVAVGRFEGSEGSILLSDSTTGASWTTAPMGPGGLTTGTGYNCLFNTNYYFVVGAWSTGVLTVSPNLSKEIPAAKNLTGSTGGTAFCISVSGLNQYLIGGTFLKTNGTYGTLSSVSSVAFDGTDFSCVTTAPISPAGVNTASSTSSCKGIAVNSAIYVAVGRWVMSTGANTSISYSYDGVTWQTPINPSGTLGEGLSVTWNGTQFIATGTWSTGSVSVSSDGITWTTPIHPPRASSGSGTSATWNPANQQWLLSGSWIDANSSPLGNLTSFSYGITFSPSFHPGSSVSGSTKGLTWDSTNSQWIAAGNWTNGTNTAFLTKSSDGLTWSNPYIPSTVSPTGVSFNTVNRLLNKTLIGGSFTLTTVPIQRSTDGITWANIYPGAGISGTGQGVAWINSTWYMVGSFTQSTWGQSIRGPILTSRDGLTWNSIIQISPTDPYLLSKINTDTYDSFSISSTMYSIAYDGTRYIATGFVYCTLVFNGYPSTPLFITTNLTSTDGLQWSLQPISYLEDGSEGRSIAWNGSIWVIAGTFTSNNTETTSQVIYSTNGITWTLSSGLTGVSGMTGQGKSVAWNGYLWVAVGQWSLPDDSTGILTTSTDGITWILPINPTSIVSSDLTSITWNGTLFSAVGSTFSVTPLILRSRDGLTWTYASPGLTSTTKSVGSRIIPPYLAAQPFDASIQVPRGGTVTLPNQAGYVLEWPSNTTYGAGTQYSLSLAGPTSTFTFTASKRTQWLSYGSFYGSTDTIQFTLTKLTPVKAPFTTDLVGPHFSWTNSLGHALIDTASLSIGGVNVETIPGQLMELIDEFQTPLEKVEQMSKFLCRAENGFDQETFGLSSTSQTVVTPLPFWFSRGDPGCALPIDALNVDEVRLTVKFKPITSLYYTDSRTATPAAAEGGSLWTMSNSRFYYQDASGTKIPGLEPITNPDQTFLPFPNLNMTTNYTMPNSHLMVEYIYLDKAEANRFRIADLQVPIVQHYTIDPVDTTSNTYVRIPLEIPNPTRDLFFYCQRYEAPGLNAHFLASRDISDYTTPGKLWWPDASGLYTVPRPGFSTRDSEPIRWLALNYAETLNRYSTENVALFRSLLPTIEQRKAPWINRYYYNLPFGSQSGLTPFSMPVGEANLDKIRRFHLALGFHGTTDLINDDLVNRYIVRVYGETYNIFRVYGGRGSMMFAY